MAAARGLAAVAGLDLAGVAVLEGSGWVENSRQEAQAGSAASEEAGRGLAAVEGWGWAAGLDWGSVVMEGSG